MFQTNACSKFLKKTNRKALLLHFRGFFRPKVLDYNEVYASDTNHVNKILILNLLVLISRHMFYPIWQ